MSRVRRLATAAFVLAAGCSSAAGGPLVVSWRFADGRDCFNAGAQNVEARTARSLSTMPLEVHRCPDGLQPASLTLADVPGSGTLYLDGVDALGADLYHGELDLEANPPGTGETRLVTLYAVAVQ
jgi:hypothetical protein